MTTPEKFPAGKPGDSDPDKLLPCPFCGKDPSSRNWVDGNPKRWVIECTHIPCPAYTHVVKDSLDEAISAWNTRTQPSQPKKETP